MLQCLVEDRKPTSEEDESPSQVDPFIVGEVGGVVKEKISWNGGGKED